MGAGSKRASGSGLSRVFRSDPVGGHLLQGNAVEFADGVERRIA